ncbi:hypothetical protein SAMN05421812_115153 [Asanoa hainanensis]|uniref:Uncharacterized protein n=1 Tax=Asanoa hainanensis TaxID=560556 RepID=A0A239PAK2_9ACTN|nr:hypothetical protein [Asanoa hainanensis]SNT63598.1 hypothetical protein SAMN05421812_115153 [Asanoa hainanensis]
MSEETIGRRRLLRRAGTVAAGVVGAGAVGAVAGSPAQADPGDALVQGGNAGVVPTQLVGNANDVLLSVHNAGGPALRLVPSNGSLNNAPVGSMTIDQTGNLYIVQRPGETYIVHTNMNASQLVPVVPSRLVNTRTAAGRELIINKDVLDSQGRLRSNTTMHVIASALVRYADAMHGNVTAVDAVTGGHLSIYPYGVPGRPDTSTLNYPVGTALANAFTVGHGRHPVHDDAISIYNSGGPVHVLIDAVAFTFASGTAEFPATARAAKPINPKLGPAKRG